MNQSPVPPAALSPADAARELSLSRSHVYNLMAAGELRSVKIGRRRVIPYSEVTRLLQEGLRADAGAVR